MPDAQETALQDRVGSGQAGRFRDAGQVGDGLADGCRGLVGRPEYDDACVASRRVAADVAKATVQRYQNPASRRGCRDNRRVECTGQTLTDDSVDVMASGLQDGGRRGQAGSRRV